MLHHMLKCQVCSCSCLNLLQKNFLVWASLKAGGLSCHLEIRQEKNSKMRNKPPMHSKSSTRHCASFLLVEISKWHTLFLTSKVMSPNAPDVSHVEVPWFFISFFSWVHFSPLLSLVGLTSIRLTHLIASLLLENWSSLGLQDAQSSPSLQFIPHQSPLCSPSHHPNLQTLESLRALLWNTFVLILNSQMISSNCVDLNSINNLITLKVWRILP